MLGRHQWNETNIPLLEASLTRAVNQALELSDSSEQRVESIGRYLVALASNQPPPARVPPTAKKQDVVPDAEIRALEKTLETALRVVRAKEEGGSTLHNLGSWLIEHKADLAEQVASSSVHEDDGGGAAESGLRAEEHVPPSVDPARGEDLSEATARYTTATALCALLTHDAALGGVPVRLMSARWMLTHYQANPTERLEHRQVLERAHGDAPFVCAQKLERMLAEVEMGGVYGAKNITDGKPLKKPVYVNKSAASGEYKIMFAGGESTKEIEFPSIAALSHMWLDRSHPDPEGKNLREIWLPAFEWVYSERVRQLVVGEEPDEGLSRAQHVDTAEMLSDEEVLEAADFGIFIDLASICQKEGEPPSRTPTEDALFRHALGNLDVIYAHQNLSVLLSTRLPSGVTIDRDYDARGWCNFERAEGQLIKPDTFCIDIGLFSVDAALSNAMDNINWHAINLEPIGVTHFAQKKVRTLAAHGSASTCGYDKERGELGMLGSLIGRGRRAPIAPEDMEALLRTKSFTNNADVESVVQLYRSTATALLGTITEFVYKRLEWDRRDYEQLGRVLPYCGGLEEIRLVQMAGPLVTEIGGCWSSASLKRLYIEAGPLVTLPELSLPSLDSLFVSGDSLTSLPDLSSLTSVRQISLLCGSLVSLPDLSWLDIGRPGFFNGRSEPGGFQFNCMRCDSLASLPKLPPDLATESTGEQRSEAFNMPLHIMEAPNDDFFMFEQKFVEESMDSPVTSCAFDKSGERFITGCHNTCQVWSTVKYEHRKAEWQSYNMGKGKWYGNGPLLTLEGHTDEVYVVAFNPDGDKVVTGSFDKTAKIWKLPATGMEWWGLHWDFKEDCFARPQSFAPELLHTLTGHTGEVKCACFDPSSAIVATASTDSSAKLWDVQRGEELRALTGHSAEIVSLQFNSVGDQIITGSHDYTARVWDVATGQCVQTLSGHGGEITSTQVNCSGELCISGSVDRTCKVWNVKTGLCVHTLSDHDGEVLDVAFRCDGRLLVTASADATCRVYDTASGECLRVLGGYYEEIDLGEGESERRWVRDLGSCSSPATKMTKVSFNSNGSEVLAASTAFASYMFDVESGECVQELNCWGRNATTAVFDAEGAQIVTTSDCGFVCLYNHYPWYS